MNGRRPGRTKRAGRAVMGQRQVLPRMPQRPGCFPAVETRRAHTAASADEAVGAGAVGLEPAAEHAPERVERGGLVAEGERARDRLGGGVWGQPEREAVVPTHFGGDVGGGITTAGRSASGNGCDPPGAPSRN